MENLKEKNQPVMIWVKSTGANLASLLCSTNITILICQLTWKMCAGNNRRLAGNRQINLHYKKVNCLLGFIRTA